MTGANKVVTILKSLTQLWEKSLDPDCYYLKGKCSKTEHGPVGHELKQVVEAVQKETQGYFDIHSIPGDRNSARDFGGISQGFILEKFNEKFDEELSRSMGDLLIDFGKDFLILGKKERSIDWGDPLLQSVPFASITLKSGYILSSSSRSAGARVRNPKKNSKEAWQEDFDTLILIAGRSFSGARLDAWSTALMAGGKPVLSHLSTLSEFKNKWSYAYLDHKTQKLICSSDLKCGKSTGNRVLYEIKTSY